MTGGSYTPGAGVPLLVLLLLCCVADVDDDGSEATISTAFSCLAAGFLSCVS